MSTKMAGVTFEYKLFLDPNNGTIMDDPCHGNLTMVNKSNNSFAIETNNQVKFSLNRWESGDP